MPHIVLENLVPTEFENCMGDGSSSNSSDSRPRSSSSSPWDPVARGFSQCSGPARVGYLQPTQPVFGSSAFAGRAVALSAQPRREPRFQSECLYVTICTVLMREKDDNSLISFCLDVKVLALTLIRVSGVGSVATSFRF